SRWSLIGNRSRVRIFASCYRILIIVLSCFYDSIIVESIISIRVVRVTGCLACRRPDIRWRILPYINLVAYRSWGCCIDQHRNIRSEERRVGKESRSRWLAKPLKIKANRRTVVAAARCRLPGSRERTDSAGRTGADVSWD